MMCDEMTDPQRCEWCRHQAFRRGIDTPVTLLKKDIGAASLALRKERRQAIIDSMFNGIEPPSSKQRLPPLAGSNAVISPFPRARVPVVRCIIWPFGKKLPPPAQSKSVGSPGSR